MRESTILFAMHLLPLLTLRATTCAFTSDAPFSPVFKNMRLRSSEGEEESKDESRNDKQTRPNRDAKTFSRTKWRNKRYIMMNDIDHLIQKGDSNAPKKAAGLVHRMNKLYRIFEHKEYKPTTQAYNLWINALAKSKRADAGEAAERVLQEMQENSVQPNVISYTSVIDAYARSKRGNAQEAERVLFDLLDRQLIDPSLRISSVTCDAVLNAWAQQGSFEAAERALAILERMDRLQSTDISPTTHSYSTVINAWAKCRDGDAAERAQDILNSMTIEPDTVVFNSVIHAWATSGDPRAGTKAMELLNRMKESQNAQPDTITYNTVISCWSNCGHINAARQAENVLNDMQKASNNNEDNAPRPNTVSYNSVLNAWSKSSHPGAVQRAQAVLEYMIESGDPAPDVISFTSVLNAWAKSKEPDKAVKCREILDQMLELWDTTREESLRPTVFPFNAVLNACAFSAMGTTTEQQRDALQVAVSTFTKLRSLPKIGPDSLTYGNMIKCCVNLMPQGDVRNNMATQLFTKCCADGMVGDLVWNEMKRAVPLTHLSQVPGIHTHNPGALQVRDLPKAWTKKTIKRRRRPKRKSEHTQRESTTPTTTPERPMGTITETSWRSGQM